MPYFYGSEVQQIRRSKTLYSRETKKKLHGGVECHYAVLIMPLMGCEKDGEAHLNTEVNERSWCQWIDKFDYLF
jgi:hypothetical protein